MFAFKGKGRIYLLPTHPVDDLLVATNNEVSAENSMIGRDFKLKNLGDIKNYLAIDIDKDEKGNFRVSQPSYIDKIVEAAVLSRRGSSIY